MHSLGSHFSRSKDGTQEQKKKKKEQKQKNKNKTKTKKKKKTFQYERKRQGNKSFRYNFQHLMDLLDHVFVEISTELQNGVVCEICVLFVCYTYYH